MEHNTKPPNPAIGSHENVIVSFEGYGDPNYTQIPDRFLDEQMHDLSGAEVKVMLYIFRRTYGFKKRADAISYAQLLNGITTHDGRKLDYGAGVSNGSLAKALAALEERGYIFRHRQYGEDGSNLATVYELNKDGKPHFGDSKSQKTDTITSSTPTPKNGVAPYSRIWSSPTPKNGDTPTPDSGDTRNSKIQETVLQHTDTEEGADALCVSDKDNTYPIMKGDTYTETDGSSKPYTNSSQDGSRKRRTVIRSNDRTNPTKTPIDGLQSQIEQKLRQAQIGARQAGKLAAQIVGSGRGLDYVDRWIAFVEQEKKTNPAGFLVRVLGELAEPPPSKQEREDLSAEKYTTGKYVGIFNRQSDDTHPST